MGTFVLVHGGWHGGWCWRDVARILRRRGHEVLTPTLTGLGERAHLLGASINLDTHIQDIVGVFDAENLSDVVLVGHSYGGMVIAGVADRLPDRTSTLVYLDAFVPEDGDSVLSLTSEDYRPLLIDGAAGSGGLWVPPVPAAAFAVNERDRAWVDAQCRPHPFATFVQRIRLTGAQARIRNRQFIYADGWSPNPFRSVYDRLSSDPSWQTMSIHAGHDLMIDKPEELADHLDGRGRWSAA